MKILVAEDEQVCQQFIVTALGGMAEQVWLVDSLRGLQRALIEHEVDAIWLDLSLLDSNAEKTLQHLPLIRAQAPKATIIVVSGWEDAYRKQALEMGADAYSGKRELLTFDQPVVAQLLMRAAVKALARGASANVILERVSAMVGSAASREDWSLAESPPPPAP